MAVAGNHDALFTEYEPAEVEHIYKASGLRCCTLAEFASWYSAEVYYEGTMGRQPSLSTVSMPSTTLVSAKPNVR